jgi:GPH family glycoside/pentoside/hexuronide:cation symporter
MAKKELGFDSQGIQKTLRFRNYFGDGIGMIALNGISGLVSMLTYFYTDKVGIAAAVAGTIIFAARIFDAVTDIAMGYIVDRTKSRFGKARPWLLYMAIPTMVCMIALFCVPAGASTTVKNTYAFITNAITIAIVYTAIVIPYTCLQALVTKSTEERSKMGLFRSISGYIIGMIVAVGLIPITNAMGGDQKAWIIMAVVLGVTAMISLVIAFFSNKEQGAEVTQKTGEKKIAFFAGVKLLFKNKYIVVMAFANFAVNVIYTMTSSTGIYFTKYILKNENLVAVMGAIGLVPVAIGFAITTPLIKNFGLAKTNRIAFLVGIAGTIIRCFTPDSFISVVSAGLLVTFGTIPFMVTSGVLINNTVEYGEWKTGRNLVGISNSLAGFAAKIGNGLGAALVGWILALGNYNPDIIEQSPAAINSIYAITIWIPGIVMLIAYISLRFYNLDAIYPRIVKELEERKTKNMEAYNGN